MGGPNLEIYKFGFYMIFPIGVMLYFSDPEWYAAHVVPYGKQIWPDVDKTNKPPHTSSEIQAELARLKAQRISGNFTASSASPGTPFSYALPHPTSGTAIESTSFPESSSSRSIALPSTNVPEQHPISSTPLVPFYSSSSSSTTGPSSTNAVANSPGPISPSQQLEIDAVRGGSRSKDQAIAGAARSGRTEDGWREVDRGRLV